MNGANRLGGNSLGDLLVFGRRAGEGAARGGQRAPATVSLPAEEVAAAQAEIDGYLNGSGTENPFQMHKELQKIMGDGVGIFRDKEGLTEAIAKLEALEAPRRQPQGAVEPRWTTTRAGSCAARSRTCSPSR